MYGEGISKSGVLLDTAVEKDIVEKAGSWFSYKGEKLGQGRENVKVYLDENPEISLEIEKQVRESILPKDENEENEEVETEN